MEPNDMDNPPTGPIEILEAYLDGALEPSQRADLEHRMARDGTLREMLSSLRAQRVLRHRAWSAREGDAAFAARLVSSVRIAQTRERVWGERNRRLRVVGAMAACLVIGFAVGRVAMFETAPSNDPRPAPTRSGNMTASADSQAGAPANGQRPVVSVSNSAAQHRVTLRDEHGQVIAIYSFDTAEQAQRFADDVNNWRPTQTRSTPSRPVPISGGF